MIWLQSPPWARWAAALLIAGAAMWTEFRPEATILHPFASEDIEPGTVVNQANTETRPVPVGTFATVDLGVAAVAAIRTGEPVLASDVGDPGGVVPEGWWSLEIALPRGAHKGDAARIVLLDSEEAVDGVVVEEAGEDPLGSGLGLVAVESGRAAEVARAVGEGRAVVMLSPS